MWSEMQHRQYFQIIIVKRQFGALTRSITLNNTYTGADPLYSPLNPTFANEDLKPDFRLIN